MCPSAVNVCWCVEHWLNLHGEVDFDYFLFVSWTVFLKVVRSHFRNVPLCVRIFLFRFCHRRQPRFQRRRATIMPPLLLHTLNSNETRPIKYCWTMSFNSTSSRQSEKKHKFSWKCINTATRLTRVLPLIASILRPAYSSKRRRQSCKDRNKSRRSDSNRNTRQFPRRCHCHLPRSRSAMKSGRPGWLHRRPRFLSRPNSVCIKTSHQRLRFRCLYCCQRRWRQNRSGRALLCR